MWLPLDIPPGVVRNGTDYQSENRWRDASLVRWQDGAMMPVGGWRTWQSVDIAGTPRAMLAWETLSGNRWIAFGCHDKLFVSTSGGTVSDVTPAGFTSGRVDAAKSTGYGAGFYGTGIYGQPRQSNVPDPATVWHLDNFGENLVGCSPDDGKLYEWTLDTLTAAAQISGSPTSCRGLVVTESRFLMALGAGGDPRKVQWSDREDNTTWTPASTNEAGDFILQTSGKIMQAVRVRGQTLVVTDQDAHTASPDPSFVFAFDRVGTNCGAISNAAVAPAQQGAIWMGQRGFYSYLGGAVTEIACDVSDYVFDDMNRSQISKIVAVPNGRWGEVWWFYPSEGSAENDRYVAYDLREDFWMTGSVSRTAGIDANLFSYPIWCDADGVAYEHEVGHSYGGASPHAETGPITLGENIILGRMLYPDERTQGDVTATFKTRFFPNGAESTHGPYTLANPTGVRFAGRQMRYRVDGAASSDWRVGKMKLDIAQGGKR